MSDINKIKEQSIFILRKEPTHIYSFTMLMVLMLVVFIILGNFIHYSKSKNYLANIIDEDGNIYFQTTFTKNDLNKIGNSSLIVQNKEYEFSLVEFVQNSYDDNYSIILKIDNADQTIKNEKFVVFSLEEGETTLFKEIYKRIKEVLNQ